MRHLGVTLLDRKLHHIECSKLLESLKNCLTGWRNKLISFEGCLELIKSALYSLFNNWIMAFFLSTKTLDLFNSIVSNFL